MLEKAFPGSAVQSFPNPEAAALELRAAPDDRRISEVGWDRATMGTSCVQSGGAWLGEYFDGHTRLPIMLRVGGGNTPEEIAEMPLFTPSGRQVRLGDLVKMSSVLGPPHPPHRSSAHCHLDHRSAAVGFIGGGAADDHQQILPQIRAEMQPTDRSEWRAAPTASAAR